MHTTSQQLDHTELTMVLDQGSHGSRIALFSVTGELVYLKSVEISTQETAAGHYEQDANEILSSLRQLISGLQAEQIRNIKSCGLCIQRSTIVAWNNTSGEALSPAISWRDLRNQAMVDTLQESATEIQQISGLPLSAHYSASKMHWLLQHNPQVKQAAAQQQLCLAPLASFLLFHLLKQQPIVIDHSNAQRTQLFDIHQLSWSDRLLKLFSLNKSYLPDCQPIIYHYGDLNDLNIPMTALCGDQNAALHAYPQLNNTAALINIGTGAFVLSGSNEISDQCRLLRSITYSHDKITNYVTEGTVNGAGAALSWAQQVDPCDQLFDKLPQWLLFYEALPIFINSVAGLGSPWWCDAGEPEFISSEETTQAERYCAIIESIIFLLYRNIQQLDSRPEKIFISGGLSRLDSLCQKLADISEAELVRFSDSEASARGCAWLANQLTEKKSPYWQDLTIAEQFTPSVNSLLADRYQLFVGELQKRCHNS